MAAGDALNTEVTRKMRNESGSWHAKCDEITPANDDLNFEGKASVPSTYNIIVHFYIFFFIFYKKIDRIDFPSRFA